MARKKGDIPAKAGLTSYAKKVQTSRHAFDTHPASRKAAGAFAHEEDVRAHLDPARGATKPAKRAALPRMKKSS